MKVLLRSKKMISQSKLPAIRSSCAWHTSFRNHLPQGQYRT